MTQLRDYFEYVDEAQGAVDVLTVPLRQPVTPVGHAPLGQTSRSRLWLVGVTTAAATLLLVGGAALFLGTIGEDGGPVAPSFVADATIPIGDVPSHLAASADALWVAHGWKVSRVDPTANAVTATVDLGSTAVGLVAGPDAVWVYRSDGRLIRLDPETGLVLEEFQTESGTSELGWWQVVAADQEAIWAIHTNGDIIRIDAGSGEVTATIAATTVPGCDGNSFGSVALAEGVLWALSPLDGCLSRVDTQTGQVSDVVRIGAGSTDNAGPNDVAIGTDGSVWVTYQGGSGPDTQTSARRVFRIDPITGDLVAHVPVEAGAYGVVADESSVWVTSYGTDLYSLARPRSVVITQIDPDTNRITDTIEVPLTAKGLAVADDALWVIDFAAGTLLRIDIP